jgi:phage-related protein
VVSAISEMASNWISKITDTVSEWKQAGIDLISGLWEGFKSKISSVADGVAGFADDMKDKIKSKLGIASPSKVFAEIGGFMAEGLGVGWDREIDDINDKIENDMNYDAQMNITPSISDIPTMNMAKTSLFSDEDLNKIVDGLSFRFTNITNIDGRAIKEETYDYFIDRATNEQRSVAVATGGYY